MGSMTKSHCKGQEELPGPTLPKICHTYNLNKLVCQVVVEETVYTGFTFFKYKLVQMQVYLANKSPSIDLHP